MASTTVLFEAEKCHVFRAPATDFLKSEAWEGSHIWTGSIRVYQDRIDLYDANAVFGSCPLRDDANGPTAVQPATDSRRCFVVRIEQGTQFAYLGLHFETREVAFQFITAVTERYRTAPDRRVEEVQVQDRRLRAGETFTVDLEGKLRIGAPVTAQTVSTKIADPVQATPAMPVNFNFNAGLQTRTGASRRVGSTPAAPSGAAPTSTPTAVAAAAAQPPAAVAAPVASVAAPPTASPFDFLDSIGAVPATTAGEVRVAPLAKPAPVAEQPFDPFAAEPVAPVMPIRGAPAEQRAAPGDFDPFAGVSQTTAPVAQRPVQPQATAVPPKPATITSVDDLFA